MTSNTAEVVSEPDLTLSARVDPAGQPSSVVPVWWCISKKMKRRLKDREIEDAQQLVVVTNGEEETGRYLFGLFDGERYISFTRPGDNTVRGVIVRPNTADSLKDGFFKKLDSGGLACDVVRARQVRTEQLRGKSEGPIGTAAKKDLFARAAKKVEQDEEPAFGIRGAFEFAECIGSEAQLVVPVASDMFAPEPNPAWRWLSDIYPWGSEPRDQCHRRQRALLTLATSPVTGPVMAIVFTVCWVASLAITAVLLFWGMRNINYDPLLHPVGAWPSELWEELDPSFWFSTRDSEGTYHDRKGWSAPIGCLPIFSSFGLAGLAIGALTHLLPLWAMFLIGFGFLPAIVVVGLIIVAFSKTSGAQGLGRWLKRVGYDVVSWRENVELSAQKKYEHKLELLACDAESRAASLTVRRTLVLGFEGAKARVCRPYAK